MNTLYQYIQSMPLETKIQRYINFDKWIHLINTKQLFFARASVFDSDPYDSTFSDHLGDMESISGSLMLMKLKRQDSRSTNVISCWTMNDIQAVDMWKLYTPEPIGGILIQSTIQDVLNSLGDTTELKRFLHGAVTYKSLVYEEQIPGTIDFSATVVFRKKPEYQHEREYRFTFTCPWDWSDNANNNGVPVAVDLSKLLKKVVVSPGKPSYVRDMVESQLANLGINIPVESSKLFSPPPF